jgi:hypothetical protein
LYRDVAWLQTREIDAPNHFSVHHQEQTITRQKFRKVGIAVLTRDNLVHRVAYGFQPLQLLNLMNHGGLIHIYLRFAFSQHAQKVQ